MKVQETEEMNNLQMGCCRVKYQQGHEWLMSGLMFGNNLLHVSSAVHPDTPGDCFLSLCLSGSREGLSVM